MQKIYSKTNNMNAYTELLKNIAYYYSQSIDKPSYEINFHVDNIISKATKILLHPNIKLKEYEMDDVKFIQYALSYPDECIDVTKYTTFVDGCETPYQVHKRLKRICGGCVIDLRYLAVAMHHNNVYNNEAIEEFLSIAKERHMLTPELYEAYDVRIELFNNRSIGKAMYNKWDINELNKLRSHPLIEVCKFALEETNLRKVFEYALTSNNKIVDMFFILSYQNKHEKMVDDYIVKMNSRKPCDNSDRLWI